MKMKHSEEFYQALLPVSQTDKKFIEVWAPLRNRLEVVGLGEGASTLLTITFAILSVYHTILLLIL